MGRIVKATLELDRLNQATGNYVRTIAARRRTAYPGIALAETDVHRTSHRIGRVSGKPPVGEAVARYCEPFLSTTHKSPHKSHCYTAAVPMTYSNQPNNARKAWHTISTPPSIGQIEPGNTAVLEAVQRRRVAAEVRSGLRSQKAERGRTTAPRNWRRRSTVRVSVLLWPV